MNALPLPRDRAILAHHKDGENIPVQWSEGNIFIHVAGEYHGIFPESDFNGWEELDWDTVWEMV